MKLLETVILPAALMITGCQLFADDPAVRVATDLDVYVPDPQTGIVSVVATVRNHGDIAITTSGCVRDARTPGLNWDVERFEEGSWVGRENAFFACAPPTIGTLELAPGAEHRDTLLLILEARRYRLTLFYQHSGEPDWLKADPSGAFEVVAVGGE